MPPPPPTQRVGETYFVLHMGVEKKIFLKKHKKNTLFWIWELKKSKKIFFEKSKNTLLFAYGSWKNLKNIFSKIKKTLCFVYCSWKNQKKKFWKIKKVTLFYIWELKKIFLKNKKKHFVLQMGVKIKKKKLCFAFGG